MLQDIFISPLPEGLMGWRMAFPKAKMCTVFENTKSKQDDTLMYWLHMNEDRQQWLTNTITQIKQQCTNAKIVVLANVPNEAEALHAMSLGAVGYLHAYSPEKVLAEVKTVVSHGGVWMGQDLLKRLIEVSSSLVGNQTEQIQQHLNLLSNREKQVALEAAKGLSNKEIARMLKITERTVKAHLTSIFERLKVKDRLHLALILNQKP
jgi:two-component system, NarL family, nitrate/nitrite response regulator NarL